MQPINNLKSLFSLYEINGYIIPSNDQYLSEYTPESFKRLKYITNFSGSNGLAIICPNKNLFFTDGRYLAQSKQELDQNIFDIFDLNLLSNFSWDNYIKTDDLLGYDPKLFTNSTIEIFSRIAPNLLKVSDNLVDKIWINKPPEPSSQIYLYDIEFAGLGYQDKIVMCRNILFRSLADTMIITALDSICWLLNLRANDIPHSPLLLGTVIITKDNLYLMTNSDRVSCNVIDSRPEITILKEKEFNNILNSSNKVFVDEHRTSIHIMDLLKDKVIEKITDPCLLPKACKNKTEIKHAINFHINDAVALCEFFAYLFESLDKLEKHTEYTLGEILTDFRSKQDGYVMDSFPTICGFKENSAIIHYHASKSKAKKITGKGLLLIDSGGQYKGCTTDITRTFSIGAPTKEQKLRYTQVLKGHIALAIIKFPANVTGSNLDVLARQFLWKDSQDYPHGTGHGVGNFLSVHEGPQNISLRSNIILKPGMLLSNEPGYYKIDNFGIRVENLMYVKEGSKPNYLEFENLTLVPYAKELINYKTLNKEEKVFLDKYYLRIRQQIHPLLSKRGKIWLEQQLLL
ncbi:MAG: aminopeptidase P family protein [Rickettsia endosymbiont of Bryobia graminum]|nr:aminopeptidase P family protein [Rickettsia endosymbiont of Bryobia graminum]